MKELDIIQSVYANTVHTQERRAHALRARLEAQFQIESKARQMIQVNSFLGFRF